MGTDKEYHNKVWAEAKTTTELYFRSDRWAWIGSIITGIVSALVTSYFLDFWNGAQMTPFIILFLGIVSGLMLGLSVFVIALWGWNGLWAIPAKMFREKEIEANSHTWRGVNFEVVQDKMFGVGLCIHTDNPPPYFIEGVYGVIGSLRKERETIHLNRQDSIKHHSEGVFELPYTMNSSIGQIYRFELEGVQKARGKELVLAVADWNDKSAWIRIREQNEERTIDLEINCEYKIVIVMQGRMQNGLDLGRCTLHCSMIYKSDNEVKKVSLTVDRKDYLP